MVPSDTFDKVVHFLIAHESRSRRVGRFLVTMEKVPGDLSATVRIFEVSGFLGLRKKLLYCVNRYVESGGLATKLLYAHRGDWYKEFEEELRNA